MAMIEVRGLKKRYGDREALTGIDFSVNRGEIVGLLGPNGAGKTTTMKILTGFISPTGGEARIGGKDVVAEGVEAREQIGYLPEAAPVYPEMLVEDYLEFIGQVRGLEAAERASAVARAMERCGLTERRHQSIGTLSKGYKQRVGLAQAILHEPDLLILDEPTSGLDPNQILDIRALIRELGAKKTIILSTHILSEVQATCDRVIIIHQGRIVADGPTEQVTAVGQGDLVHLTVAPGGVRLPAEQIIALIQGISGVGSVREAGASGPEELSLEVLAERDVRAELFQLAAARGLVLLELRRERSNLEEVFHRLTTG